MIGYLLTFIGALALGMWIGPTVREWTDVLTGFLGAVVIGMTTAAVVGVLLLAVFTGELAMVNMLIVVTGSRTWDNPKPIIAALNMEWHWATVIDGGEMHVMHGACPSGADAWAHRWCVQARFPGVVPQPRPANWARHGPAAGPLRNAAMIREAVAFREIGWHVRVLAFLRDDSKGTTGCIELAREAGFNPIVTAWVDF